MKPARITLTDLMGVLPEEEHTFEGPTQCIIGRGSDCDLLLPSDPEHANVSRHHCVLEIDPPTIRVRDLGSRNGTFVNGEKIGQRSRNQSAEEADLSAIAAHELKDGDELQLGYTAFRVGIFAPEATEEPELVPLDIL